MKLSATKEAAQSGHQAAAPGHQSVVEAAGKQSQHPAHVLQRRQQVLLDSSARVAQAGSLQAQLDRSPRMAPPASQPGLAGTLAARPAAEGAGLAMPAADSPLQLHKIVVSSRDLSGSGAQVHYHITYESTSIRDLHVTFTNTSSVGGRTWQVVYTYQHNRQVWTGPHTVSGSPSTEERSLIGSHVGTLQQQAVSAWQTTHAAELSKRTREKQRAELQSEDRDTAFPALSSMVRASSSSSSSSTSTSSSSSSSTSHAVAAAAHATPSPPGMYDEDYGMTKGEDEPSEVDYAAE